jgi:hypothetical protein
MSRELERARALLRRIEWSNTDWESADPQAARCPACDRERSEGHASDCELDALVPAPSDTEGR